MLKKNISLMLALVLTLSIFTMVPVQMTANASTGGHSQADAVAWANAQIGKSLDYDGEWGAQCVDLIYFYYQYLGVSPMGGNACDYTWNSLPSGWQRINYYSGLSPNPGDICVWGGYQGPAISEFGHIGIVTSGNANTFSTVEQNVGGQYVQTVSSRQTNSVACFIRPDFITDTTAPTISNARAENISSSSFDIKCDLNDDVGVTRVWLNIFGPSGSNGYAVSASNGSFSHTIRTSDYGGSGLYTVHIYAFDAAGNETPFAVNNINTKSPALSESETESTDSDTNQKDTDKSHSDNDKPTDSDTRQSDNDKPTDSETIIIIDNSDSNSIISIRHGDVDDDKLITMTDVVYLQRYIAKLIRFDDKQQKCADVNHDGEITMLDVTTMQKFIAKLIDKF